METSILSNLIKRLREKHNKYSTISIAAINTFDSYIEDDPQNPDGYLFGQSEKEIVERFECLIKMDEFPRFSKHKLIESIEYYKNYIKEANKNLQKFND